MKVSDLLTGVLFCVIGSYVVFEAQHFPAVSGQPYGSTFFPTLIGSAMILGGLFLAASSIVQKKVQPLIIIPEWLKSTRGAVSFLLIFATLGFYMLFADTLGFCITAFLIILILQKWMGSRLLPAFTVSFIATGVFYTVFAVLLRVPLPHGFVEQFLGI